MRDILGSKSADGHRAELKIGLDAHHQCHINPRIEGCNRILDVGCGAGQTLVSAFSESLAVGVDLDLGALRLGRSLTKSAAFVCAGAERLPFASGSFDLVISRVALPYTYLSRTLREMRRVLVADGWLWVVLHPIGVPWREAVRGNLNSYIYFLYVLSNSLLFHYFQFQFAFPGKGCESFQTRSGFRKALAEANFDRLSMASGGPFVVTARAK